MNNEQTASQAMEQQMREAEDFRRRQRLPWAERSFDEVAEFQLEIERAVDFYRNDIRARALIDASISMAREMTGPIDPERADRDAHDLATYTAAIVLARIYTRDSELAAVKLERDQFRAMVEKLSIAGPLPSYVAHAT